MFSVMSTGMCWRPLWTAIVRPTISGTTIERRDQVLIGLRDRKSTRLNSSHSQISYAVFCLKKKMTQTGVGFACPGRSRPGLTSVLRLARAARRGILDRNARVWHGFALRAGNALQNLRYAEARP